jgi:hypothetical protein
MKNCLLLVLTNIESKHCADNLAGAGIFRMNQKVHNKPFFMKIVQIYTQKIHPKIIIITNRTFHHFITF